MLRHQFHRRFGVLSPQLEERLSKLSISQLEELGAAMFDFSAVDDLMIWLQQYE